MRKTAIILLAFLALSLAVSVAVANTGILANGFSIPWWTVDGGGGTSQGGTYTLSGSIGQSDAGSLAGGNYALTGGFWGITLQTTMLYLPIMLR